MWKKVSLTEQSKGVFSSSFYKGEIFAREYEYMPGRYKVLIAPKMVLTSVKILSEQLARNFYTVLGSVTEDQQMELQQIEDQLIMAGRL